VNYLHGLPFFAVSVACARGEARRIAEGGRLPELLAGAVLMPALGLRFAAELEGGATLNGRPLRLAGRGPLERALVGVSMSVRSAGLALPAAVLERVAANVQKVRALGATAGELALVAAGKLDGMVHHGTHLWDLAAGTLVALEAGAVVDARPAADGRWNLLAANPDIFLPLSQAIEGT
jgi:myo-inositol-1(or 4)-monophosphatase